MQCSYKLILNVLVILSLGALFYILHNETLFQTGSNENFHLAPSLTDDYNVWFIFTKADNSYKLRQNLRRFATSLVLNASIPLSIHIITDNSSQEIADHIFNSLLPIAKTQFSLKFYDVNKIARFLEGMIHTMQQHFSSQPGAYYADALFFLSLGLHKITSQHRAILMDIDTELRVDVKELFDEFNRMPPGTLVAAAPEQTPVYRHVLHMYRANNRGTNFGEPLTLGGNPGVNSGVLLLNLADQRESQLYSSLLKKTTIKALTDKYQFHGHLGDQDWYTLISQEHSELIHFLDCTWNRQLCLWWRHHGYHDIFDLFHHCNGSVKIYHGNCNTDIPLKVE